MYGTLVFQLQSVAVYLPVARQFESAMLRIGHSHQIIEEHLMLLLVPNLEAVALGLQFPFYWSIDRP